MRSVNPYGIYCLVAMFRLITAFSPTTRRTSPTFRNPSCAFSLFAKTSPSVEDRPIPTILLAGFLGSGKTTTLKHLLENNQSIKIGTIVNDVASVNIDAKLLSNTDSLNDSQAEGVVELQNGCACCSLADELMESVMQITSVDGKKRDLDAIVVELSGVADPVSVRDNWKMAELQGHPATKLASLHRTITLVDASTFGTDWMTWDAAGDREDWTEPADGHAAMRKIPELLAEQVEAADLLLVNKVDLAGGEQTKIASGLARGLNEKASIREVEFGKVEAKELLGSLEVLNEQMEHDHNHAHSHGHSHEEEKCADPGCTDKTHLHEHKHSSESSCSDPGCTDTSHSHSHDHSEDSCADPDCTDTSHSHSHDHQSTATATDQLGISSFVYKQSRPFNSQRLLALLNRWPLPIKDSLDMDLTMGSDENKEGEEPEEIAFAGVLRSKGFCWMAPQKWSGGFGSDAWRHDTAMYWSHAGKHFGIQSAGKWWGTLGAEDMKPFFEGNEKEYDRIMREDWVSEEWGDRRQELVFIGAKLVEKDIRAALDECLCTDQEMDSYRTDLKNYLDEESIRPSL